MCAMNLAEPLPTAESETPTTPGRSERAGERGFEVVEGGPALESLWRAFQDEGICSPYQRFDWVQSFAAALAAAEGFRMQVLLLRGGDDSPLLLLPLAVRQQHGVTIASIVGGKQANFHLPLMAPGLSSRLPARRLQELLVAAGRDRLGIDCFVLRNQPLSWRGDANPLAAFGGSASVDVGYRLALGSDAEGMLTRSFSGETRKKMRKKRRSLGEVGTVRFWRARSPAEAETVLSAFLDQKEHRFRELGIANPFRGAMQTFLRAGSVAGLASGRPAIELYALSAGDRIVATFGGAGDNWRLCGMFNSFDGSPDVARCSPGELLLADLIRHQCEIGRTMFDLGVGEAHYKTSLCDEVEPLIDVFVPVTPQGRLYAAMAQRVVAAKRFIKHRPWALRAVNALRGVKAKARGSITIRPSPG
jgi:CelD/BcsL family acetyltransferase involved in cellulose biosynthesis